MKIKTNELTGKVLDWAVAQCEGVEYRQAPSGNGIGMMFPATLYSSDWDQGGPIIEREGISTRQYKPSLVSIFAARNFDASKGDVLFDDPIRKCQMVRRTTEPGPLYGKWLAQPLGHGYSTVQWDGKMHFPSDTLLEAAMRCYVASKLGAEVDAPDELVR